MRIRKHVDLNDHLNRNVANGNPADFRVSLRPVFHSDGAGQTRIERRRAVVREDTGESIAIVSDKYVVIPHTRILDVVEEAIRPLDVGAVPRGVYVDHRGAQMRAIFKFPSLAQPIVGSDEVCPCIQVRNTYDGTSRISLQIGAFRFVCTNLAVGGGGVFAGGFMSIHAGEIPIESIAERLTNYLTQFDRIVQTYQRWSSEQLAQESLRTVVSNVLKGRHEALQAEVIRAAPATVFEAYNRLTHHATHKMRTARRAFAMLEAINGTFQREFGGNQLST